VPVKEWPPLVECANVRWMEQVSDLPNVRFYTANEDIQAGGLATVGIDGIVRAATSPRTPLYRGGTPSAPNRVLPVQRRRFGCPVWLGREFISFATYPVTPGGGGGPFPLQVGG